MVVIRVASMSGSFACKQSARKPEGVGSGRTTAPLATIWSNERPCNGARRVRPAESTEAEYGVNVGSVAVTADDIATGLFSVKRERPSA